MDITFKLFATLTDYLPKDRKDNAVLIQVADGTTIQSLIDQYNLPEKLVHLVLVNGVYVDPADRGSKQLTQDDVLAIWPPVAGG